VTGVLDLLHDPQAWLAFLTLSVLEIVLGIDNLIFIAILIARLPSERRRIARLAGLGLAMGTRIALLYSIVWLTRLTAPWFELAERTFSGRDVVLLCGGLFLLGKSVVELHHTVEAGAADVGEIGAEVDAGAVKAGAIKAGAVEGRAIETGAVKAGVVDARSVEARAAAHAMASAAAIVQIALIDIVFSLDSVFTAVGLAKDLPIMAAAIVVAILVMMLVSASLGAFIERHPTIKVLALAFLILIGVALVAQAFHFEIPRGYLYFAMAFAAGVELINIRVRRKRGRR